MAQGKGYGPNVSERREVRRRGTVITGLAYFKSASASIVLNEPQQWPAACWISLK